MASRQQRFRIWNQNRKQKAIQIQIDLATAPLLAEIAHLRQHRSWLWQTANKYLQRARDAERRILARNNNIKWLVRQARNETLSLSERISIITNYPIEDL